MQQLLQLQQRLQIHCVAWELWQQQRLQQQGSSKGSSWGSMVLRWQQQRLQLA
jgi:hypothetical protein